MSPEPSPVGWSPNPIYNQSPLYPVAPTPLGAQAQVLMSPAPAPGPPMAPMAMPMSRPRHRRMRASHGSPGSFLSSAPAPSRFQHYVPSVRYHPPTEGDMEGYDEEDDEFVLVEGKATVPEDVKVGRRTLPLLKGMKSMFRACLV
jgi:hypothetical protein